MSGLGVQRRGGLVAHDETRLVNQGPGQRHSLLLPARKLGGQRRRAFFHPQLRQEACGLAGGLIAIHACGQQWDRDVLGRGERREQVVLLENKAKIAAAKQDPLLLAHPGRGLAQDLEVAAIAVQQSRNDGEQGGLPAPAGPDQHRQLTHADFQIHAAEGVDTSFPCAKPLFYPAANNRVFISIFHD